MMWDFLKQFGSIFSQQDRIKLGLLFLLILCSAIMEVFSIGAILPIITIISRPDTIQSNAYLHYFYTLCNASSTSEFLIITGLCLVVIYIVKNIFLFVSQFVQSRFVYKKAVQISYRLFQIYLNKPYTFHLQRNTAELMRNVTTEVGIFILYLVTPILQLLTDLIIAIAIFCFVFYVSSFASATIISILGISILLFYMIIKKKISYFGNIRQFHVGKINQQIMQAFGGIKETKVLNKEHFFTNIFRYHITENARANFFHTIFQLLPRYIIECSAIFSIIIVMILLLLKGQDTQSILIIISLFAMAAARIMPIVNRITSSITTLRYGAPSLNILYKDLKGKSSLSNDPHRMPCKKHPEKITFRTSIKLDKVTYKYPNTTEDVLCDISLIIPFGASIGFVGLTGAGKTTLIDLIIGLLKPNEGIISVDNENIHGKGNLPGWQCQIGYIPQNIFLSDETIRENIAFGVLPDNIDDVKIWEVLGLAQLEEFVRSLEKGLDTTVGEQGIRISGGQRQRIGIARALYHNPTLLVFDEATASLDNETERAIIDSVKKFHGNKTIITIAHRLTTVKNCDTIYFLMNGQIHDSGSYSDLLRKNKQFKNLAIPYKSMVNH